MPALAALCGMLPGWIWALICAGMLAVNGVQMTRVSLAHNQVNAIKQQLAEERGNFEKLKAEAAAQRARDESAARKKEQTLQAAADNLRSQKDAEIQSLRADVRSLRDRLQYFPARPADTAVATNGSTPETPGAREAPVRGSEPILYRDIGERLVSEAERADTIRLALIQCYSLWDQAKTVNAPR